MLASLLSPTSTSANKDTAKPRISQLLPTVKCSTCHQPVPLDELGEHTCSAPPPMPSPVSAPPKTSVPDLPKPALTQEAATALLPGRLQSRVVNANNGNGPSSANVLRSQSPSQSPSHQSKPSLSTASSSSSGSSSSDRLRISTKPKGTSPTFQPKSSPLARKDSQMEESLSMRSRSRSSSRERLGDRMSPLRTRPLPNDPFRSNRHNNNNSSISSSISNNSNLRIRTPSNANGSNSNQSTPSTARPLGSFSNTDREVTPVLTARPVFPPGPGAPLQPRSGQPVPLGGGPISSRMGPTPPPPGPPNSINFPPRTGPSPGPVPNNRDPRMMANPRNTPPPPSSKMPNPNLAQQSQLTRRPTHVVNESFVPPAERGIDTKTGGEAGMAGVGRRGFAAAARAAMFVQSASGSAGPGYPQQGYGAMSMSVGGYGNGMVGRPNVPQYLDIDAASRSTPTPPLSAGSGYSSHSPGGPTSPLAHSEFAQTAPVGVKPTLQIPPVTLNNSNNSNPNINTPHSAISPTAGGRLPFFDKLKNSVGGTGIERSQSASSASSLMYQRDQTPIPSERNNVAIDKEVPPPPSPIDSESEYGGLAYADSTDYEDNDSRSKYDDGDDDFGFDNDEDLDAGLARAERRRRRGLSEKGKSKGHNPGQSQSGAGMGIGATMLGRNGTASSTGSSRRDESRERRPRGSGVVIGARSMSGSRTRTGMAGAAVLPGLPLNDSRASAGTMMRSISGASSSRDAAATSKTATNTDGGTYKKGHAQFGSVSTRARSVSTDRDGSYVNGRINSSATSHAHSLSQSSAVSASALRMGLSHSREGSISSTYSSTSANGGEGGSPSKHGVRTRADSAAAIAAALGLSRSNSLQSINGGDYSKLGGPGVPKRADSSRSRTDGRRDGSVGLSLERGADRERAPGKGRERNLTIQVDAEPEARGRAMNVVNGIGSATMKSAIRRGDKEKDYANGEDTLSRSKTVQSPETSRPIKLPTRSMTSPTMERDKALFPSSSTGASGSASGGGLVPKKKRPTPKTCMRCKKVVDDGRWVSVGSESKTGGVLCEKCWKGMYLPKCRRCNLPIEKQAVSSSDGQLKGKYHKECFNCHVCNKPFPDKSFYVYDGKPLCAYHYHEANDSLCAAALCGQPIEGPCAVSHTGDRYHPEHMTCEFYAGDLDRDCGVRLEEYWEVDGRMLCERHANAASRYGYGGSGSGRGSGSEDDSQRRDRRAKKRVTRFIDLTGGANGAPGLGDSGLR